MYLTPLSIVKTAPLFAFTSLTIDSESEYLNVNVKSLSLRTCKANNKLRSFGA